MPRMQATKMVLQQMHMLDQQVAAPLSVAKQRMHLGQGARVDLPALWVIRPAPPARSGVDAPVVFRRKSHNHTSGVIVIATPGRPPCGRSGGKQSRSARG